MFGWLTGQKVQAPAVDLAEGQQQEGREPQALGEGMIAHNLVSAQCAWCMQEQGLDLGNGSHDICVRHAEQVYANYQERRARRL